MYIIDGMEKEAAEFAETKEDVDQSGFSEKQSAIATENGVGEFKVVQKPTQGKVIVQKKKVKRKGTLYDAKDMEELD